MNQANPNQSISSSIVDTYSEMAALARKSGNNELAGKLMAAAKEVSVFGAVEIPSVLDDVLRLADVYCSQARFSKAEQLLERSLREHEELLGKRHRKLCVLLDHIASVCVAQNKYPKAMRKYLRAMAIARRHDSSSDEAAVPWLRRIYHLHVLSDNHDQAQRILSKLERIQAAS